MEFKPFPKLARLNREIVITEKIDGTNAQIYIFDRNEFGYPPNYPGAIAERDDLVMLAGSRTKWIYPGKQTDNAGFAAWVQANAEELFKLGPGQHFGEWWGGKIQRGYGLTEKRFSLFNTGRWVDPKVLSDEDYMTWTGDQSFAPACCHVVPVLYQGPFAQYEIWNALSLLRNYGSQAAPGFMNPEGIVVYHTAANSMFKVTLEADESPKSLVKAA